MKSNLNRKWLARFLVVFLFTTVALPFGPERRVSASACDGVTPGSSAACPAIITDAPGLDAMRNNLAGHYALGADIDLSDYLSPTGAGYNDGDGWEPIGGSGIEMNSFRGSFNGNGYTISNLKIIHGSSAVGFFGSILKATIRNVGLINVNVLGTGGTSNVGGLTGQFNGSSIENVYVTGTVKGVQNIGGLAGYGTGVPTAPSQILSSYVSAIVTGPESSQVGALVGHKQGSNISITESYYNSSLTGTSEIGTGLTTSQMKHAASFLSWDFSAQGQWGILEGMTFPMHRTTLDQIVLDELAINDGEMVYEPEFAPHIATYSSRVTGEVDSVKVAASSGSSRANVLIDGEDLDSKVISLVPGANNVEITVSTDVAVPGADANPFETAYTLQVIREDGIDYAHRITTASQLAAIGTAPYALSGIYELMNDLDLAGLDWNPIGDGGQPFAGTFEGNRHVIRHLTVDSSDDYAGLFGASSGSIRNIGLENAAISGGNRVGGLVGSNTGIISNAYVKGNVAGDEHVGGLVGLNSGAANVTFTYAAGHVSGNAHTGGLIGGTTSGVVDDSYWDAEIGSLLISGGGEGKSTADMKLPATYEGWDWDDSWAMIKGTTYPMFVDSFDAVKLQSLAATAGDAELTWTSGAFSPNQGVYELLADRYTNSVTITTAPADSNAKVTIGTTESVSEQMVVAVGSNEIVVTTTGVIGRPDGEYRLIIEVPAPELIDFEVPEAGLYGIGNTLAFTVGYGVDVDVDVTGAPTIPVMIGEGADATTVYAVYAGQPVGQRNKLLFTYVVQEGLAYDNDIEIGTEIGLPDGAEIHVAGTDIAVQRNLPTKATTGIVIDAVRPEITLTKQPSVPTIDFVEVQVEADGTGSALTAKKWAKGLRAPEYFATEGTVLIGDSFQTNENGTYSVFAKDEAGNNAVATIEIDNIVAGMTQLTGFDVPAAGYYGIGDTLTFIVSYAGNVDVAGAPTIPVMIGEGADATTVYAVYAGQPAGERNKLIFTYDVQEGLAYDNAIEIGTEIGLPDGAEIHVADTDIAVQRNLPTRATTGIVIDAVRPEILLTQEPANTVPTNEAIAITVNADGTGSAIAAVKWAEGLRTKAYFAEEGIELSEDSFRADANGTYSVFAQDEAGNSFVATIEIGNIIKTLPQISLTPTLAEGSRSVSVSALAEAHGDINWITKLNWMPGSRSVADFADGTSGTDIMTDGLFIVTENDVYTVYVKDAAGNEAVAEIRISNIWNPVFYPVPIKNQELQLNYTDFGIQLIVDSSIISKKTLDDGTVVEHVELTDKILERVLDALGKAAGTFVSIVVDDSEQAVQVQFPASSLFKLKAAYPAATFEVRLNASSYELQVKALPLEPSATHVNIAIAQIAGQQKESLERAANNAGLKRISHAVSYEVTVSSDGRIEEIRDFGGVYIVRAIVLDEGRSDGPIVAVLYDPATGTLTFAPAVTRARDDGTPEMAIKVPHNSIYAIMEADNKSYSDLDSHWAKTSVELLASKLIVNGVSATEFAPNSSITRAEFTSLLVRGLGLNVGQSAQSAIFHDVAQGDWHAAAIEAGVRAGLAKGVTENEFAPDRFITREQMAVMLSNALAVLGYAPIHPDQAPTVLDKFEDHATISPWAKAAVAQAVNAGIISGMADDLFAPSNFATRAQAAVMLRRFLQYVEFID
ncbi:S-layer homology domain-containing protein [Paenibacillus sp. PAMC21692]|uniref:S-layer homology domain-containing protein n=1 Tax=Paenibacillus sp. PAMC21692 TaxID=2762320 RepID=UPI00164DE5A3|nr:S-layer homology domain-containing protein [Paenibacillus sp. PAMC21692]QNK56516.1 S-layer homology domain-containing protein [Paenibacillus sp. PAMC21692]